LLFHCAAGKDRTGIVAAVLLGLLGVADDDILDDYEMTSRCFTPRRIAALAGEMERHGVTEAQLRPLLEARRPVLAATIRHVDEQWGGFDGYATRHLGVPGDLPARLRTVLLVPA
jgi:protein-tyrosine phosphatase